MSSPESDLPPTDPSPAGLPPICGTLLETRTEAFLERMAAAAPHCALLELRLDLAPPGRIDLRRLLAERPRPVIVTCRPRREGGSWIGDEDERLDVLRQAAALGAEWIDVEWDAARKLLPLPAGSRAIVSRHRFQPTRELEPLFADVRGVPGADLRKVAVSAGGAEDALRLLALAAQEPQPTLAVAMGDAGLVSRLAGGIYGAPWLYAAASPGRPGAPGQLPVEALAGLLRGRRPGAGSELYGVLGDPVLHSRSPALMNEVFARLGRDALHSWLETRDPLALLREAERHPRLRGLAVTLPHKSTLARALPALGGRLAPEAAATGALNTLVRASDGAWEGSNTDALAARALVREWLAGGSGGAAAVLGSGGSARALVWALRAEGVAVTVFARREASGRALAEELGAAWGGPPASLPPAGDAAAPALIAHCTPLGMHGQRGPACLVEPGALGPGTCVYELVYTPVETELVRRARAAGARVIDGRAHFLLQAQRQLDAWLGAGACASEELARAAAAVLGPTG